MTKSEIVAWVKAKLGYPVVQVEIPDETIEVCIEDALGEVLPWYSSTKFITVNSSNCIDLSKFNIREVISVRKGSDSTTSAYSNFGMFSDQVVLGNRYQISTQLESMLYNQSVNYLKDNLSYDYIDGKLFIDMHPNSTTITIEYLPEIVDVEEITDIRFVNYIKNFTLAFARNILGQIRGKFKVSNSPLELDSDYQNELSSSELERLRQSIREEFIDDCIMD